MNNQNEKDFSVSNEAYTAKNGKGHLTYCSRCGAEMYSNVRYCMKCGNLNADHPDNKEFLKYIAKKTDGYSVGSGQSLIQKDVTILNKKSTTTAVGENTGGFNLCFAANMILFLVLTFGTCFYYYLLGRGDFISIVSSNIGEILLRFSIIFLYAYSLQLVFMKMNRPWWQALIPFYNFYVLAQAVVGSDLIAKLTLIPVVGQFIWIYILYKMGPCFKKSSFLMVIIPFLMIPLIAFDGSAYYRTYYTSGENRIEDEFHMKRLFLLFVFFFSAVSVSALAYTNSAKLKSEAGKIDTAYLINASNIVIGNVKKKVSTNKYTCDFDADVFYFYYSDIADYFYIPFSFAHAPIAAYVKVEKVKQGEAIVVGKYNYSISITDGTSGFPLTPFGKIKNDTVILYDTLDTEYDDGNDCYLHEKS